MARKGNEFGSFLKASDKDPFRLKAITTEFSKGSIPNSIMTIDRESAWSRWRRGYELATAAFYDNDYTYAFKYEIPTPSGTISGNPTPIISGAFVGFPTRNKELGMHWAVWRYAGALRCDEYTDPVSSQKLYVETITEDSSYWYVKLAGTWSSGNPLPPPFYIPVSGQVSGVTPANTEIFEDRIIVENGPIITKETINPNDQRRYGYVQAIVVNIDPFAGILQFKKAGSVYVTPDAAYVTPSPVPFETGRFLTTGSRYCCTCQDFTHRDYTYLSAKGESNKRQFPRSSVASIKPGRFEVTSVNGVVNNNMMTRADVNRSLEIYAPLDYELNYTVTDQSKTDIRATRDNPGVYREFGATYIRSTANIAIPGSIAEGLPVYTDYSTSQDQLIELSDNWTPLLDEMRYCKHIYALKFKDRLFPPEPSDFPVGEESMVEWEQKLVEDTEKEQQELKAFRMTRKSLAAMDVPPYNCQSPAMFSMIQKLFNIATNNIQIQNFTMFDNDGQPYTP